jgi:thiamine pyrophosphokinase
MKIAYVFLNGEIKGSYEFYKKHIDQCMGDIFCADGGLYHADKLGVVPIRILGDFDSVDENILEKYKKLNITIDKFSKEKDKTDGEIILDYVSMLNYDKIYVVGGTGGRTDHLLTNLNLIFKYKNVIFLNEYEIIFKIDNFYLLNGYKSSTVSFIPFSENVENLSLIGFKYPLKNYDLIRESSRCMGNIAILDQCRIEFKSGKLLCLIQLNN